MSGLVGFCKECGGLVDVALPHEDSAQARVSEAVVRRGYLRDWTIAQFLMRQLAKMAEELGEAVEPVAHYMPSALAGRIGAMADTARWTFDSGTWPEAELIDDVDALEELWRELADMQVVLFCAAEAVGKLLGDKREITAAALRKAEDDITRGVR